MGENQHTADLRNVNEGDSLTIQTTMGETFDVECESYEVHHADERTGEVRETRVWTLIGDNRRLIVSIIDGLKSSPNQRDFPRHKPIWEKTSECAVGYVDSVKIHGPQTAAGL